ncbi:flagellar protein FlaG [Undibacterium cyanobacteriorum]|uniref:Flagellar protein FlaG n=1 Tax=Undibacterium cyanobacteriorum TaxID=3073561 RepID=A0ABY9RPN3_9BURK|nr:flagellar protein FlaG [Undibacterium sp. 20NA77.5]WMW82225.1 flagellar protein FlaG [Undibacterium sp. 20NA77.5]
MNIQAIGGSSSASLVTQTSDRPAPQAVAATQNAAPAESFNPVSRSGEAQKNYTTEQINEAVKAINKTIQSTSQNLEFSVDGGEGSVVVKVVDQQTKEVLRQIPSEEALEIAKSLDKLQGLLIKQTA